MYRGCQATRVAAVNSWSGFTPLGVAGLDAFQTKVDLYDNLYDIVSATV